MEIQDWAEQIFRSGSLKDKLYYPSALSDLRAEERGLLDAPARAAKIAFSEESQRRPFPSLKDLEKESARGEILHFFANHELLALELMAFVLLKFPHAPKAFRRGLVQTMQEEQTHMGLYLERMQNFGVGFGDLPLSNFFWKTLGKIQTLEDFSAGMSLCFEQANLDYSLYFEKAFRAIGDETTADHLQQVYLDEIKHVKMGLHWFNEMTGTEPLWDRFQKHLVFPLSPRRAKGLNFDRLSRQKAGFSEDFIDQLEVYESSRGYTPRVFIFHAFSEKENFHQKNAGKSSYTPNKIEKIFEQDLAIFPMYFAKESDVLILPKKSSIEFLKSRKNLGFRICEQNTPEEFASQKQRKYQEFCPWGYSPKSLRIYQNHASQWQNKNDEIRFAEEIRNLQSKVFSSQVAKKYGSITYVVSSFEELEAIEISQKFVAKPSHDSSGKDFVWFSNLEEIPRKWFQNHFEKNMSIVVEPWLDRILDLSFNFERRGGQITSLGYLPFLCSAEGKFLATFVQKPWLRSSREIYSYFEKREEGFWQKTQEELRIFLQKELQDSSYEGPLGVDAFVYRTNPQTYDLRVISEINFRYTMGRLALALKDHVHASSHALLWITNSYEFNNLQDFEESFVTKDTRMGTKIVEGRIALNDPKTAEMFLALLLVSPDEENLLSWIPKERTAAL